MKNIIFNFNNWINSHNHFGPAILRMTIALVFIWFGFGSVSNPEGWSSLIPAWMQFFGSPILLIKTHGIIEMILGCLLFAGYLTRIISIILFINLATIVYLLGWGPSAVRDIGLLSILVYLFFRENK